jgi:hypothetical protein
MVLIVGLMGKSAAGAQEHVETTEISPNVLVFATSSGNVVASVAQCGYWRQSIREPSPSRLICRLAPGQCPDNRHQEISRQDRSPLQRENV